MFSDSHGYEPIFCKDDSEVESWLAWVIVFLVAIYLGSCGLVKRPAKEEEPPVEPYWDHDDYVGASTWDDYEYRPNWTNKDNPLTLRDDKGLHIKWSEDGLDKTLTIGPQPTEQKPFCNFPKCGKTTPKDCGCNGYHSIFDVS